AHGNYAFGYQIKDKLGATNSRSEVGDGYGKQEGILHPQRHRR
ncbi:hypothetical protein CEXT_102531, partial [Caerostris extrusa]